MRRILCLMALALSACGSSSSEEALSGGFLRNPLRNSEGVKSVRTITTGSDANNTFSVGTMVFSDVELCTNTAPAGAFAVVWVQLVSQKGLPSGEYKAFDPIANSDALPDLATVPGAASVAFDYRTSLQNSDASSDPNNTAGVATQGSITIGAGMSSEGDTSGSMNLSFTAYRPDSTGKPIAGASMGNLTGRFTAKPCQLMNGAADSNDTTRLLDLPHWLPRPPGWDISVPRD